MIPRHGGVAAILVGDPPWRIIEDMNARLGRILLGSFAIPLLIVISLLVGCAKLERDKKDMALEAAAAGYGSALRWGYFETASGYVHPDRRDARALARWQDSLRITGYDVVQPAVVGSEDAASQVVRIDYLYEDRQVVHRLVDRQEWRYDPESGSWWLYSGLPRFD